MAGKQQLDDDVEVYAEGKKRSEVVESVCIF